MGVSGWPGSAPLWSRGSEAGLLRPPPPFPIALGSGCQDSSPALLPGACHTGRIAGRIASFPCWRSADDRSTCLAGAAVGIKCTVREPRMGAVLGAGALWSRPLPLPPIPPPCLHPHPTRPHFLLPSFKTKNKTDEPLTWSRVFHENERDQTQLPGALPAWKSLSQPRADPWAASPPAQRGAATCPRSRSLSVRELGPSDPRGCVPAPGLCGAGGRASPGGVSRENLACSPVHSVTRPRSLRLPADLVFLEDVDCAVCFCSPQIPGAWRRSSGKGRSTHMKEYLGT